MLAAGVSDYAKLLAVLMLLAVAVLRLCVTPHSTTQMQKDRKQVLHSAVSGQEELSANRLSVCTFREVPTGLVMCRVSHTSVLSNICA